MPYTNPRSLYYVCMYVCMDVFIYSTVFTFFLPQTCAIVVCVWRRTPICLTVMYSWSLLCVPPSSPQGPEQPPGRPRRGGGLGQVPLQAVGGTRLEGRPPVQSHGAAQPARPRPQHHNGRLHQSVLPALRHAVRPTGRQLRAPPGARLRRLLGGGESGGMVTWTPVVVSLTLLLTGGFKGDILYHQV